MKTIGKIIGAALASAAPLGMTSAEESMPSLQIELLPELNVCLWWTNVAAAVVEKASDLSAADTWQLVGISPVFGAGGYAVTMPAAVAPGRSASSVDDWLAEQAERKSSE